MPGAAVVSRGYLATVDGCRGRVRATFERCAYVAVQGGPALVLHADGGDRTPTSLCPATWPPAGSAIDVGDDVIGRAGHLKVGGLVLDVRGARVWRPAPAPVAATMLGELGADHLPALRAASEGAGELGSAHLPALRAASQRTGVAHLPALRAASRGTSELGAAHLPALRAASRRTGELVPALSRALERRDADRVAGCVASLVGRGPGLTPSGDDALVGLLAVLHRLGPAGGASLELLAPAVTAILHRTGDISAHYLRLAVAGHVGERLVALCDALAAGEVVDAAAAAVAATGATSGADALLGVCAGVRLLAATSPTAVAA